MGSENFSRNYVVFRGRRLGVYFKWVDTYAQCNGFKDSVVRLYDTYEQGQQAWETFCAETPSSLKMKSIPDKGIDYNHGYTSDLLLPKHEPNGKSTNIIMLITIMLTVDIKLNTLTNN